MTVVHRVQLQFGFGSYSRCMSTHKSSSLETRSIGCGGKESISDNEAHENCQIVEWKLMIHMDIERVLVHIHFRLFCHYENCEKSEKQI